MGGLGAFSAGEGPAGFDPVDPSVPAITVTLTAPEYDPATRDNPGDDAGALLSVHPVDQSVAMALHVPRGSIKSAPLTGIDYARLKRTRHEAMQDAVNDVVRQALATLISRGDITLLGSPLMPDAAGRPFFFVDYVNLRLPSSSPRTGQATVRGV